MEVRDSKRRIYREAGGKTYWLMVRRLKCKDEGCGRIHVELPDILVPYKHYGAEIIEDVIEDVRTSDDLETEDYPCEGTMNHWKWWFLYNRQNIEGQLKSVTYHLLDLDMGFLRSGDSLLEGLQKRISPGWLKAVIRYLYNAGGRISPNSAV